MHNFDVERETRLQGDRTFQIGGQTFTYRPSVAPEKLIRWAEMSVDTPEMEAIEIIDETVVAFLEDGQAEKWKAVRNPDLPNPLNANDISGLVKWLMEEQTGRPTSPSSASTTGSGNGAPGTILTGVPDSPVVPA